MENNVNMKGYEINISGNNIPGNKGLKPLVSYDHVHILLCCCLPERDNCVKILKSKSTYYYKKNHEINEEFHLWAQKYNSSIIKNDAEFNNVYNYIEYNELKHEQ